MMCIDIIWLMCGFVIGQIWFKLGSPAIFEPSATSWGLSHICQACYFARSSIGCSNISGLGSVAARSHVTQGIGWTRCPFISLSLPCCVATVPHRAYWKDVVLHHYHHKLYHTVQGPWTIRWDHKSCWWKMVSAQLHLCNSWTYRSFKYTWQSQAVTASEDSGQFKTSRDQALTSCCGLPQKHCRIRKSYTASWDTTKDPKPSSTGWDQHHRNQDGCHTAHSQDLDATLAQGLDATIL